MAESGLSLFLSVLFLLLFVTARVYCCGMSTHIDIAHQAINWFKDARNGTDYREIILKHQDAFIAGNPYPDSMYSSFCYSGKFHSIAEDTHWSPFLNATVNYIRKKYPKPWDQVSGTNKEMTMMTMMIKMMMLIMHQSIPPAPSTPPGWPPGISIFFALDGKFPGVGTLELSNPPG